MYNSKRITELIEMLEILEQDDLPVEEVLLKRIVPQVIDEDEQGSQAHRIYAGISSMASVVVSIIVFIIVIVVHELAHAYVAYRMGDATARDAGRLTLNPLAHADPVGTVLLPALLILARSPVIFGWAKPVPVDPRNFADPRKGMLLTSLAGPGANLALAVIFAAIFKLGLFPPRSIPWMFLLYGVVISLVLGIFNMMPIPPLDGAGVVSAILPPSMARHYAELERYGFIILIGLLYLGLFDKVILPATNVLTRILVG